MTPIIPHHRIYLRCRAPKEITSGQWTIESTADDEEDTLPDALSSGWQIPRPAYESPSTAPVLTDMPQGQDEETPLDEEPVPPPVLFADLSDVEDDTDLRPHTISLLEPDQLRCIQVPPNLQNLHRLQRNRFVRQLSRNHFHLYISRWG